MFARFCFLLKQESDGIIWPYVIVRVERRARDYMSAVARTYSSLSRRSTSSRRTGGRSTRHGSHLLLHSSTDLMGRDGPNRPSLYLSSTPGNEGTEERYLDIALTCSSELVGPRPSLSASGNHPHPRTARRTANRNAGRTATSAAAPSCTLGLRAPQLQCHPLTLPYKLAKATAGGSPL